MINVFPNLKFKLSYKFRQNFLINIEQRKLVATVAIFDVENVAFSSLQRLESLSKLLFVIFDKKFIINQKRIFIYRNKTQKSPNLFYFTCLTEALAQIFGNYKMATHSAYLAELTTWREQTYEVLSAEKSGLYDGQKLEKVSMSRSPQNGFTMNLEGNFFYPEVPSTTPQSFYNSLVSV